MTTDRSVAKDNSEFRAGNKNNLRPIPSTAMVVPCYNEEKRINVAAFIHTITHSPHINFVFVNDGSRDATLKILNTIKSAAPESVSILDLPVNSGKAEAVRQGLIFATKNGADFVGYWDADLATPLDAIDDFVRLMKKFDCIQVVYGARRRLLGHNIDRTISRRLISRLCALMARCALRLPIGDTQCGAKLLRNTSALRNALHAPFNTGWIFDVELFIRLSQQLHDRRRAFYEQPLAEWQEVAGSKVSTKAVIRSGLGMARLIAQARLGLGSEAIVEPVNYERVSTPKFRRLA